LNSSGRVGLFALPYAFWLLLAFAAPLGAVALLSIQESSEMFAPLSLVPSAAQYGELVGDAFYRRVFANTLHARRRGGGGERGAGLSAGAVADAACRRAGSRSASRSSWCRC
jgi:hypothetical protein